ncbi:MAG: Beta-hexosaminidase [Phycisphaerae bacterium]|nr:Beta-hexosaminidase [Phycisphaerae bacterium]
MADRQSTIETLLSRMTLQEKIGQCMTLHLAGTILAPYLVEFVTKYNPAGLRTTPHIYTAEPYGNRFDPEGHLRSQRYSPYTMPDAYADLLNRTQDLALHSRLGIPMYFCSDSEGDLSQDYCRGGVHLFPSQMGLAASGDEEFVYRCALAVARQQRAVGIRMLHSPCLDVNIEPKNPEICTRSFSDDAEKAARFGLAMLRGFRDGGLIATGKHFPGRGDSAVDVHFQEDRNKASRQRLHDVELLPYRKLIAAGLPAIMTAHTVYEAIDPDRPASVSRKIVHDLLRVAMGFEGVITTDAIGMKGVVSRFDSFGQAVAEGIAAGNDLVLVKSDLNNTADAADWVNRYVQDGRIPMAELDDHVRRVLAMKWDYGIFSHPKVDAANAMTPIRDPETHRLSAEAAERAAILVRDRGKFLPLAKDARIFFTDQRNDEWLNKAEDQWYHSHMMAEYLREHFPHVTNWECQLKMTEEDEQKVLAMSRAADVVVMHATYWRGNPTNVHLARKLIAEGKKVVLVAASPYRESTAIDEADCLIVTFSSLPRSMENAAALIAGKGRAAGVWPLETYRIEGV